MSNLHSRCLLVFAFGLALCVFLSADLEEASAQVKKTDGKAKTEGKDKKEGKAKAEGKAKTEKKAKAPVAAKPSVQKKTTSHVSPKNGKHHLTKPTAASEAQLAATIVKLRSINHTLEAADHDYGGHRASAFQHVKTATHDLVLALEHAHKGAPKNTTKEVGSSHEAQRLSDKQLAATIPALKKTHKLLQQGHDDYGGHRAAAVGSLGTAITQLEKALDHSKAKNSK